MLRKRSLAGTLEGGSPFSLQSSPPTVTLTETGGLARQTAVAAENSSKGGPAMVRLKNSGNLSPKSLGSSRNYVQTCSSTP